MNINHIIQSEIDKFINLKNNDNHRYKSFDFCYHYFYTNQHHLAGENLEKSCLMLWSFLASWGMLRGSSFLLKNNMKYLSPLIEEINKCDSELWEFNIEDYDKACKIEQLIKCYRMIEHNLSNPTITLVTKIMLGVFSNSPAFDRFFKETMKEFTQNKSAKFTRFNENNLRAIYGFYLSNQDIFNKIHSERKEQLKVSDFDGSNTPVVYNKIKLIDMFAFQYGITKAEKRENHLI